MTLLRPPAAPTTTEPRPSLSVAVFARLRALGLALLAGILAVVVSFAVMVIPVVLAWFFDDRSSVTFAQTLGVGIDVWALAHRGVIEAGAVQVVFAPLLLTCVPLLIARYAVGQVLVDRPDRGVGRVGGARAAWRALGGAELTAFVTGYVVTGGLLCSLAALGQAPVQVATVVPGLLLVPTVAIALGLLREHRRQEHPVLDRGLDWVELHTPVLVRRGLRPAAEALGLLAVTGLVMVVALLVLRAERIGTLYAALDAGVVGTAVLTLAQLAALPNLIVWAVGWTTGAEVHVGTVAVGWTESSAGDLPLVPVLAALPEPGPLPPALWVGVFIPVLVGCWVGWRGAVAAPRLASWWTKAQIAGSACIGAAVVVLLLTWLASGGMTPGRLAVIGTDPWTVAGLLLAELLAGALTMVTVLHLARRRL